MEKNTVNKYGLAKVTLSNFKTASIGLTTIECSFIGHVHNKIA